MTVSLSSSLQPRAKACSAIALGAFMACGAVVAGSAAHAQDAHNPDYVEDFERRLDAAFASGEFVGLAVAVVKDGDLVSLRAYGDTEVRDGEAVTPHTVFRLASVSKGFASTLVGQLVAEGRLDWADRADQHQPEFSLNSRQATNLVTLERIASHTAGVPAYAYDLDLEAGVAIPTILERTARTPLACAPGTCYQYQNTVYNVLADAAENATGVSFDQAMQERVFEPLGMFDASVGLAPLLNEEHWARPHVRASSRSSWQTRSPEEAYYRVAAAGGLNASIEDLVQWVRAQLGHEPEVVSEDVRARLHTPVIDTPREQRKLRWMGDRLRDADYALGWRVYDYAGQRLVLHAGGVEGYRAMVAMAPDEDLGIAILWNSSSGRGWRIMPTLMDAYFGLPEKDWLRVADQLEEPTRYGSP